MSMNRSLIKSYIATLKLLICTHLQIFLQGLFQSIKVKYYFLLCIKISVL